MMRCATKSFLATVCAAMVLVVAVDAISAEVNLRQFAMFASPDQVNADCKLIERYSPARADTAAFAGAIADYGCEVAIAKKSYEQLFQQCYQSGINAHKIKGGSSYECSIQERESDYLFRAFLSEDAGAGSQIMCYFSCIAN